MQQYLIEFLKALESRIPPPQNCHHAVTFAQYGSAEAGWKDALALQVNVAGQFHCVFLLEKDLENRPATLADAVVSVLGVPMSNAQLGIGFGQYVKA
jgi:hypothetical protein